MVKVLIEFSVDILNAD